MDSHTSPEHEGNAAIFCDVAGAEGPWAGEHKHCMYLTNMM